MKKKKYLHIVWVLFIFSIGCKSTQKTTQKTTQNSDNKQDWVKYLFQNYMGEKPSASFAVIKDGKLKDCQSFGYADLENRILANCETNYRLASVTKQFTAMGVLILINKGKLKYDTTLTEILSEFPDYGKEITVKDLLAHRSGLQDYSKLYQKGSEKQLVDKDVLNLLMEQDSLLFPANSKYKYSNSGYAILALIIERVSGKTFKDFMDNEIFEKIGMTNSTVYLNDIHIKNRAFGYKFNDTIFENKDQNTWSAIQGDGGIYSSVTDYVHWDRSLYDGTLITTALKNDAFSNWTENGKTEEKGYGFGWQIDIRNDRKLLMHGGSTTGFRNYVVRIPSEKISVVIYTNTADYSTGELKRKALFLASLYSDGKLPMPIDVIMEREIDVNGSDNIEEYYNTLIAVQNKYETNTTDLVTLGFRYLNQKQNTNCLNVFTFIKEQFPDYFGGYFGLAQYYRTNGNNEKAIEYFKKVPVLATGENQGLIDYSKKMIEQLSE